MSRVQFADGLRPTTFDIFDVKGRLLIEKEGAVKGFKERRRYPRFDTRLPIRFQLKDSPSKFGHTLSRDISEGGMRLTLNEFLRPKTEVLLETIVLGRIISPLGKVVWSQRTSHSDSYQIGLEFLEIDRIEREKLKSYIDYKRGA